MDNVQEGCDEATALTQPCDDAVDDGDGLEEQASLRIKYGDGTVEVFRREEPILHGMPAFTILLVHLCRVQHACGVDLAVLFHATRLWIGILHFFLPAMVDSFVPRSGLFAVRGGANILGRSTECDVALCPPRCPRVSVSFHLFALTTPQ